MSAHDYDLFHYTALAESITTRYY